MTKLEKIQQKVNLPNSLKSLFQSGSNEFNTQDYFNKINVLRSVVQNGFSTYDLTEIYKKRYSTYNTAEDMQSELMSYIGYLLYSTTYHPIVKKYYESLSDHEVAKDLDAYLMAEEPLDDFKKMFFDKFAIAI
jgi:hypothetical protein